MRAPAPTSPCWGSRCPLGTGAAAERGRKARSSPPGCECGAWRSFTAVPLRAGAGAAARGGGRWATLKSCRPAGIRACVSRGMRACAGAWSKKWLRAFPGLVAGSYLAHSLRRPGSLRMAGARVEDMAPGTVCQGTPRHRFVSDTWYLSSPHPKEPTRLGEQRGQQRGRGRVEVEHLERWRRCVAHAHGLSRARAAPCCCC